MGRELFHETLDLVQRAFRHLFLHLDFTPNLNNSDGLSHSEIPRRTEVPNNENLYRSRHSAESAAAASQRRAVEREHPPGARAAGTLKLRRRAPRVLAE